MSSKLPIDGNSLLEQYELCPHRMKVRVVTTYNRREPPVRLQDITHLERLGVKPLLKNWRYCIWVDMDLSATTTSSKTKMSHIAEVQPKSSELFIQKPTLPPIIKSSSGTKGIKASQNENVSNRKSLIWLMKPSKPLVESTTNIFEFTKEHLCSTLDEKNVKINTVNYATKSNHAKNYKLKRTLSKTVIDTKNSKNPIIWNCGKLNKMIAKSPRIVKVDKREVTAKRALGTTVTEIIAFENIKKGERHVGGADQLINKPNIKYFPVYSTSSNSQLSVDEVPRVKKALSKRVRNKAQVERSTANRNVQIGEKIKTTAAKELYNSIAKNRANEKLKKCKHTQKMASVISSQGNANYSKDTSKTTNISSPFAISERYKNIKKEGCQVLYHTPVVFNLAKSCKSAQKKRIA